MMIHDAPYDLLGIGFGPSNLALAITFDEVIKPALPSFSSLFLEKQDVFTWHGGMLLPDSDMQISFLKDLVSLRDPTSPYSFINYLHTKGRLEDFVNQKTFYPSRIEFNDYLCWVADHFRDRCAYGEEVVAIEAETSGDCVECLRVISRDPSGAQRIRRARNLAVAAGGKPKLPAAFAGLMKDGRIFHSSAYLDRIGKLGAEGKSGFRIAVVGGGQSGAELFVDLKSRFPEARIDLILSGGALRPADDSPFVNEIFNTGFTDILFRQEEEKRRQFMKEYHNTNYSVVDPDLIQTIYGIFYQQKVAGPDRLAMLCNHTVVEARAEQDAVLLTLAKNWGGTAETRPYDAVVVATGYERDMAGNLLKGLEPYFPALTVTRDYRLPAVPSFKPSVFVQGCNEATHGLSDTLLSVISVRSMEIATALRTALTESGPEIDERVFRQQTLAAAQ